MGLVGERVKGIGVKKERGEGWEKEMKDGREDKEARKRRRGGTEERRRRRENKKIIVERGGRGRGGGGNMINKMTGEEENVSNL